MSATPRGEPSPRSLASLTSSSTSNASPLHPTPAAHSTSSAMGGDPMDSIPDIIDTSSGSKDYFEASSSTLLMLALDGGGGHADSEEDEDPYLHVPPPPVPSPCVRSVRSKRRSHQRRSVVERRRGSQLSVGSERGSGSCGAGGRERAGTGHSDHGIPLKIRASVHKSGGPVTSRRRLSQRATSSSSSSYRTKKQRVADEVLYSCSSTRMLFRMMMIFGMLSVSWTVLANRSLLYSSSSSHDNSHHQHHFNADNHPYDRYPNHHPSSKMTMMVVTGDPTRTSSNRLRGNMFLEDTRRSSEYDTGFPSPVFAAPVHWWAAVTAARAPSNAQTLATTNSAAASSTSTTSAQEHSPSRILHKDLLAHPLSLDGLGRVHDQNTLNHRLWQSVAVPHGKLVERHFDAQDRSLYNNQFYYTKLSTTTSAAAMAPLLTTTTTTTVSLPEHGRRFARRVLILHQAATTTATGWTSSLSQLLPSAYSTSSTHHHHHRRKLQLYPPDFTDPTQLYGILDSSDERMKMMERKAPLADGECVPMQEWQTTFFPTCNRMHELDMSNPGSTQFTGSDFWLFGVNGYWRNAWKVNMPNAAQAMSTNTTVVIKTLKIEHRFEEKMFENNRIDALAMERLTPSRHVIDIYSFCGSSVISEYADGKRLGQLADKSKKEPLARLRIALDIATGLADVHGIDGDDTDASFVHLDINPANVVSIGGTLKLNDFNIGIMRRRNTTSGQPCGIPSQYPNPQWRSPEEARGENNLTEKVDVFSMGHIFFRLICGHEPWNKLEPDGKPTKAEVNDKVQRGVLPFIPEAILHSKDPEEIAIRQAMLQCYNFDPQKRPSARSIANKLKEKLKSLEAVSSSR